MQQLDMLFGGLVCVIVGVIISLVLSKVELSRSVTHPQGNTHQIRHKINRHPRDTQSEDDKDDEDDMWYVGPGSGMPRHMVEDYPSYPFIPTNPD